MRAPPTLGDAGGAGRLLGAGPPDLTAAARAASLRSAAPHEPRLAGVRSARRRALRPALLRGLFCGGTLCDEAMLVAGEPARTDPVEHPAVGPSWP